MPDKLLDFKRLRQDATRRHAERPLRRNAGTFAAIQAALPEIRALRADGIRWTAIAEALAAQGVTQGSGETVKPITTTRLTAIVSELARRERRDEAKRQTRLKRSDLADVKAKVSNRRRLRLAEELTAKASDDPPSTGFADEEAIRRSRYEAVKGLMKK